MCFSLNVSLKMSGGFYVSESKDTKQTDRSAASLCVQLVRVGKTEQLRSSKFNLYSRNCFSPRHFLVEEYLQLYFFLVRAAAFSHVCQIKCQIF